MKKLISIIAVSTLVPGGAYALSAVLPGDEAVANCCTRALADCEPTSYHTSCTSALTCNCNQGTLLPTTNRYGVVVSATQKTETYCVGTVAHARCVDDVTTYTCGEGYYGTATSATTGCTACPDNATCAGGNDSTFVCDAGYYENGTSCTKCATATGHASATSAVGSTAITDCYLPILTGFGDDSGSGFYMKKCYYAE